MVDAIQSENEIRRIINDCEKEFLRTNRKREKKREEPIPESEWKTLRQILDVNPLEIGIIDAADNWVVREYSDGARIPNDNEWHRLKTGALDGQIGMSLALQWRYNFRKLFRSSPEQNEESDSSTD